jgi:sucrose-6-phosphate hydrolase SacC (GH32 family)
MAIKNLDYECYLDALRKYSEHQEDWLKVGYAPQGFYLKDFCLIEANDLFHLFHIAGTPGVSCCLPGNEVWFGHATTGDFQTWKTLEPCLYIQPDSWDNGHVFAPFVLKKDDLFWMFYTGCAIDNTQRIGVATSENLQNWQRISDRPVIRPEGFEWAFCPTEKGSACRDPHICKWSDEYSLYYTAVTKNGKGCVARATSNDLVNWTDRGPAYTFSKLNHCESSNVQELDDRYLLFFGGHHEYWSYVISENPYHWPDQEPVALEKGITAMEVIRRAGKRWLVAYFKFDCYRMFLGIVDWSERHPTICEISSAEELVQFGI